MSDAKRILISQLSRGDTAIYQELGLHGLKHVPGAFGSTYFETYGIEPEAGFTGRKYLGQVNMVLKLV